MVILYAQDVEGDLDALAEYIAADNPRRAVSFLLEVYAEIERIGQGPLLYQAATGHRTGCPPGLVGRYVILFRTAGDVVYIERVVYGGRELPRLFNQ